MDDDAVFCTQCGSKLTAEPVEKAEEAKEEISDIVAAADETAEPTEDIHNQADDIKEAAAEEMKEEAPAAEKAVEEIKEEAHKAEKAAEEVISESNDTVAAIDEALEALSGSVGDNDNIEETHDIPLPEPVQLPEEPVVPQPEHTEAPKAVLPELKKAPAAPQPAQHWAPTDEPNYIDREIPNGPAPVYGYPADQPAILDNVPVDENKAPVKVGAFRLTGAGVIAFFTVIFMILLSLMFCVKLGASGDTLKKRTAKMDINTVLDANYRGKSLSDAIYNEAGFGEASHGQVSKSDFRIYMAKTDLLSYAGEHIKNYTDFIINGESADPSVTTNDMVEFFSANSDADILGYEMQVADYNRIRSNLDSKNTAKNFSIDEWSSKLHFNLANANFIFSYVTLGIILGFVIVLMIWMIVVVGGRGKHVVGLYGNIFSWSGAVVFIVGLAIVAGASIAHVITGEFLFYLCASLLLPLGVFAICIGAAEFVIGFIFKRIRRGIRNKEKRNKAVEKALAGTAV